MKVLIWILCLLANSLLSFLILDSGVIIGAIPATLLTGGTISLAHSLCNRWDDYKWKQEFLRKRDERNRATSQQIVPPPQEHLHAENYRAEVSSAVTKRQVNAELPATSTEPVKPSNAQRTGYIICPQCGTEQRENRACCFNCSAKFERPTESGNAGTLGQDSSS